MQPLDKTAWEILNATADDCENLEQIYRQVCYELVPDQKNGAGPGYSYRPVKRAPFLSAIADRLHALVEQGLLAAVIDEEGHPVQKGEDLRYVWRAWFRMTAQGRAAWESSERLLEQE